MIIQVPNGPRPQAEITHIDVGSGNVTYRWLDESGNPVDSGNSVARVANLALPITAEALAAAIATAAETPSPNKVHA